MSKEAKAYHHKWISDEKDLRDRYEVMQDYANKYHKEQLLLHGVVVNEAEKEFKPCGEGDNICNCKVASECGYSSEVELCEHPMNERADIANSNRTYCLKCSTAL